MCFQRRAVKSISICDLYLYLYLYLWQPFLIVQSKWNGFSDKSSQVVPARGVATVSHSCNSLEGQTPKNINKIVARLE